MKQLCRPNAIFLTTAKNMAIPNGIFSKKMVLHISHSNINSLLPKNDKIRFVASQ